MTTAAPEKAITPNELTTEILPLTTLDTCDGCGEGTTAALRVHTPFGAFLFCWHHARRFGLAPADFDVRHMAERSRGSDH